MGDTDSVIYRNKTEEIYKQAAQSPDIGLCCSTNPVWKLPGLEIPSKMLDMNYGCGSTVHMGDLEANPKVLYVGAGGGLELLQFAYFSRFRGGVKGLDVVDEMLEACRENLNEAEKLNPWFHSDFVELLRGDALDLPVENESIDVAAQNCLFNIFRKEQLKLALQEIYRVLKPHGRLVLSDPICQQEIPGHLRNDPELRALCLSGARPLEDYLHMITDIGFGTVEVRARRPYRVLSPGKYDLVELIYIESVEICAIKDPMPADGPCIFTGRTAIYHGDEASYNDGKGHLLLPNQPASVCDKTAEELITLNEDIYVSESTWFYDGGGCC